MMQNISMLTDTISQFASLRLFLDYDGTLADFAPNPDLIIPDVELIQLLRELLATQAISITIISGRKLAHLKALVPLAGLVLAGTYGIEVHLADGSLILRENQERIRSALDRLKPEWQTLLENRAGFYLEDKGWTLAIHAKNASTSDAQKILKQASQVAQAALDPATFQIHSGHRFLEAGPLSADKGSCVRFLLEKDPPDPQTAIISLGDDDKDEAVFRVVQSFGGFAVRVCSNIINDPVENFRLPDPASARVWLRGLIPLFSNKAGSTHPQS